MTDNGQSPFDSYSLEYDKWFDDHPYTFQSELNAIRQFIPGKGRGIEIGVGTGRFASQLGISTGVEPSEEMASLSCSRGIEVYNAYAENLPIEAEQFDFVLITTTICFVTNPVKALKEAHRILKPEGKLILGIIDRETELGKLYETIKDENKFYKKAHFYSTREIIQLLQQNGYIIKGVCQTIFSNPETMITTDPVLDGYGSGAFVVIISLKQMKE